MSEAFRDWLGTLISGYVMAQGRWVEDASNATSYFCVLQYSGRAPENEVRYPSVRVLLVGPRAVPGAVLKLQSDAELILQAVTSEARTKPVCAANVRATSEPVGPGYTKENRAWFSLDFELIL